MICGFFFTLTACSSYSPPQNESPPMQLANTNVPGEEFHANYASRLPTSISSKQKTILVDPKVHAWGAYQNGNLVYAGLATSGADWCPDIGRSCHTVTGTFHIYRLGGDECRSRTYPIGEGGALMPYCMFFHGGFSLHGSTEMADANMSHGCVRMKISDAQWVRYNFATIGTKVIVEPYY